MHDCTLQHCPSTIDTDVSESMAAGAFHICERCEQWDAAGLVAIDTVIQIINLDMHHDLVSVCHTCAAILIDRRN